MGYCLPKAFASQFLKALREGKIEPEKLVEMSSEERRAFFEPIVGKENAREVNAAFESKLLLKDQQRGLVNWAKSLTGIKEPVRRDMLAKIAKMDKILTPSDEHGFLSDLAEQKLGTAVTEDEAAKIMGLSQTAIKARTAMEKDPDNQAARVAYGHAYIDMTDYVERLKPVDKSLGHLAIDILNIPKSALTSVFHLSAPFVQGWGMLSTPNAWRGFGQMFKYFAKEENYKNLNAYMISHPDYELAKDGKLGITRLGDRLTNREEAIQSTLVERANQYLTDKTGGFVPNLVRASSRAFTGYLNYVRFTRFTDLLTAARNRGEDVTAGSRVVSDIAKTVNDFTGRGALGPGDKYGTAAPALNTMFFSPRKMSATINMFNPERFLNPNISKTARIGAIRQLVGSVLATAAVLALAKSMGADVDLDPRSSNFLKIQVGGEKFDVTGGNAIYTRLWARLITNQSVTAKGRVIEFGKGYKPQTRADEVIRFGRNKLSPVAGALADFLYGSNPVGQPFSVTDEAKTNLLPITINSFIEYYQSDPKNGDAVLPSLATIFGVGMESPPSPRERRP